MSSILDQTIGILKKRFVLYIAVAAFLFLGDVVFHYTAVAIKPPLFSTKTWGYFMFVIALFSGVGVPIFLRSSFQRNAAKTGIAKLDGYQRLQSLLMFSVFISCIASDIAYFFPVQTFYLYGAFFSCLYGIYSVIPYRKKIAAEMKFYKLI
ncbi:MAG: hypothetical protein PQJ61_08705 [Spirochaetales bacterium]|uniref:Uncharacterized protein n=1 Tax=Candidatus Thalassospirochaeta sargassi TaxID=3119039 RepID=A0AAJ1MIY8_9SPIO|nr:hypothetical protein [Spirochaetales bacterium]